MSISTSHIHVNDVGITLRANVNAPLHDLEAASLLLKKPNGTTAELVADVVDANTGIISYKSKTTDFNAVGKYQIQAKIVFLSGTIVYGAVHSFHVTDN
jgi:hypothetical protein